MEVKVSVFDVATGKVLESAVLSGKSGLTTIGGDHPQDLLPEPAQAFAGSLFQ